MLKYADVCDVEKKKDLVIVDLHNILHTSHPFALVGFSSSQVHVECVRVFVCVVVCVCVCVRPCVCAFDGNDYRLDLTFSEFLVCSLLSSAGSGLRRALVVVTQVCARIGRRCNATATFSSALYQSRKALQHSPQPYTKVLRRCNILLSLVPKF